MVAKEEGTLLEFLLVTADQISKYPEADYSSTHSAEIAQGNQQSQDTFGTPITDASQSFNGEDAAGGFDTSGSDH